MKKRAYDQEIVHVATLILTTALGIAAFAAMFLAFG